MGGVSWKDKSDSPRAGDLNFVKSLYLLLYTITMNFLSILRLRHFPKKKTAWTAITYINLCNNVITVFVRKLSLYLFTQLINV